MYLKNYFIHYIDQDIVIKKCYSSCTEGNQTGPDMSTSMGVFICEL